MKALIKLLPFLFLLSCGDETTGPDKVAIPKPGTYEYSQGTLKSQIIITATNVEYSGYLEDTWVISFKADFTAKNKNGETVLTLTNELEKESENGAWSTTNEPAGELRFRSITETTFQMYEDVDKVWQTFTKL